VRLQEIGNRDVGDLLQKRPRHGRMKPYFATARIEFDLQLTPLSKTACGKTNPFRRTFPQSTVPHSACPQLSTLNSQLSTLNSQLSTLNSQPSTLNLQLQKRPRLSCAAQLSLSTSPQQ
jgi:hypothetical protein